STGSERVNSPSVVSGTMPPPSTSSTQRPTTTSQVIHNDQQGNKNSSKQPKKKKKVIKDIDDHVVPQVEANTTNLPTITKNKFDEINTSPPDAPTLTTMPCQKPINLKINESGQHVLPFPRRVDGISTHRLIRDEQRKQQQLLSSTKSRLESYIGIHGSTEEEKKEGEKNNLHFDKYLYSMAKV
ncbi:unnamed protein product, partial [Rotaria sp. Silwood1]